ncbi:MAG: energy transducer TonB [Candidatus Krumholzibacteriia bacterium]
MKQAYGKPPSIRSTRRHWAIIIASAVLLHAAFLFLFKPGYLEVFRTELPPGEESTDRYPFLDNPFHVLSLSVEPRPAAAVAEKQVAEKAESAEDADRFEALGEPQSEMLPLRGGGGGGTRGSRNATVEPKPLYIPWPKYPAGLKKLPEGRVELMLLINEKGEVDDVKVTRTLPLEELNRIAVEAARRIRFTPGTEQGVRKPMWVRLAIAFQPR